MDEKQGGRTIKEEIEVAGSELVERVKELVADGKVRRLRIKEADGDMVLEMPLNIGVLAGGAVALAAPWLAVLGVLAALVARVRVEIIREADEGDEPPERGSGKADAGSDPSI
ncbi:MAG: hypothetical protein K0S21_1030 [Rhizobiaceae bacterium]|jgi:hypothetical protein|nr:hypothetical protein [Rhizobiaceae bacterium]